jgi:hypothetical protein
MGAMSGKPQSSYHSGNRDSNRRSSNQRRNANRTHQPTRRFHTGGWPALGPSAPAQQGEFTMVQVKKHKPAPDMDRPTYKGLVQKAIKDRSIHVRCRLVLFSLYHCELSLLCGCTGAKGWPPSCMKTAGRLMGSLVVTFGFESSDPSSNPGVGSRTFSGLALNKRSRRLYKGAMSHSLAENMDLVVIHGGTHAAKGEGLLRRETRRRDNSSLHLLVVT